MSDVKQVKVDNWGIYFLQRLKHFFNRTDYCDLTLQFQDNAQLKVHRLVLNACTEYFELLERTCEMYEDCLVMPEDLQADVVVPIVNFMYTGQLEFRMDALERLYQTSQIMNMPVLSKLLEAHRVNHLKSSLHNYGSRKFKGENSKQSKYSMSTPSSSGKRSFTKAFESNNIPSNSKMSEQQRVTTAKNTSKSVPDTNSNELIVYRDKKLYLPLNKQSSKSSERAPSPIPLDSSLYNKKLVLGDPRPTRYELPEELDTDNVFDSSFTNISYTTKPLMVHPDTSKQYSAKKSNLFSEATSSKKSFASTVDIVECKKISKNDNIFDDDFSQNAPDDDLFQSAFLSVKDASPKDPGQLFDQILDNNEGPKVTIESKDKQASNLDHAKIISEVLKRYPHLVKSNKNIKLKILNTPTKGKKTRPPSVNEEMKNKTIEIKPEVAFTYETDVLDSKEAAKLISMGAENIKGPWICLICGTPGRALNFNSYYNFRRHLVEVHKEKPVSNICEHCGLKSFKRNYLLHHIYTKHGVPPPPQYHFPKCPMCDYIALTEGFLIKHKLSHCDNKTTIRCSVCSQGFASPNQYILHIQKTGHKQQTMNPEKKQSIQCSYCMKVFLRDNNFFCHLKTAHKEQAIRDGVIDESDDEKQIEEENNRMMNEIKPKVKHEHSGFENELEDDEIQYQVQKRHDFMQVAKKPRIAVNTGQKILNTGYNTQAAKQTPKPKVVSDLNTEFIQEIDNSSQPHEGNIVVINDVEYIMKDNQLIPRKPNMRQSNDEYILSDFIPDDDNNQRLQNLENVVPTTSMEINNMHSSEIVQQPKMILKSKAGALNQPIQIVVSNEEEYKALMASNHSIIFDDGDPNKTLTVLTAPQNTSLDTTGIDLDNTQSNDMMIIQEDYPLNVSEAVPGDNSKYVVVYSHAMNSDDPNKQYQIITPQDIGAQFVQNSAVLTQNYDTITTSTSVVSANVIGTDIGQSWQQSDQHNVNNQTAILVTPDPELQTITDQTNMNQNVNETHLVDVPTTEILPETEILRIPSKSTLLQLQQQCNMHSPNSVSLETITTINPEQMVVEVNQANSLEEPMNINIPAEPMIDKENTVVDETQITTEHEIETECHDETSIENMDEDPSQISISAQGPLEVSTVQEHPEESMIDQEQQDTVPIPQVQHEAALIVQEHHDVSPIAQEQHDAAPVTQEQPVMALPEQHIIDKEIGVNNSTLDEDVSTKNIETEATNVIKDISGIQENTTEEDIEMEAESVKPPVEETREQIQNLASEWSEDEYDNVMDEPESSANKLATETNNPVTEEPELEESIENIQHEVQKQISDVDNSGLVADFVSFPAQKEETSDIELKETPPNMVVMNTDATQEKISSLLNDWEDNDSQEDNASNSDDIPATVEEPVESNENGTTTTVLINNSETETPANDAPVKKDDNIKSLVSDWDDDDEENKE